MRRSFNLVLLITLIFLTFGSAFGACGAKKETDIPEEPDVSESTPNASPIDSSKEYGETIINANKLSNGVKAYYTDKSRDSYVISNQNMSLQYSLSKESQQLVRHIKNNNGNSYLENTMDIFITSNGKTYYASSSTEKTDANAYRLGYYYYDLHLQDQNFYGNMKVVSQKSFSTSIFQNSNQVSNLTTSNGVISYTASGDDPYVFSPYSNDTRYCFAAESYNAITFSAKVTVSTTGHIYFAAGGSTYHTPEQIVSYTLIPDGEWHEYTVLMNGVPNYSGTVSSLRFDIGVMGEKVEIKDICAAKLTSDAPDVVVERNLHVYSDKMNQVLHFVATKNTSGITALGMETKISEQTVEKLIVKDKNGTHSTVSNVDWNSAEYIAFDIKNAGIFGYILLNHENSGKLTVTPSNGFYVLRQTSSPSNGILNTPNGNTNNDFYMGHRVYTDESHSFDTFLKEAEYERNPIATVSGSSFVGYDALRGAYKFTIDGTDFNEPFFNSWNKHYTADVTFEGIDEDRTVYIYTEAESGCGECAVILDKNNLTLPIPTMIFKNFVGENEEPIFYSGDKSYSETLFPLTAKANETVKVKVLNLYQNWGAFPLKQLSSIQFFWPYYHLSVGTTETSCISPWYGARDLWTLPDFRSQSMPYWYMLEGANFGNQPQHTHGGYQYFLQYTDKSGTHSATENIENRIQSSGPVYASVDMDYISDDGKIKVTYSHNEQAQTDELRAMYEITYTVLEDVTINDFKNDFSFYSFEGYAGTYQNMGYLDINNQVKHKATNGSATPELLILGDNCPYVSLYNLNGVSTFKTNNVNLGFVVQSSDFTVGGKKINENFVIVGENYKYRLSLNLDSVTLKKGDVLKLNMIISPWGYATSTDDSNIQEIRKNTCLNPIDVTVADGEKIDSVFIKKIKSTNGKTAEFTISGGTNNNAVRIYGFDTLTYPKIYEKVNGEWVEYIVSSINSADRRMNAHNYDGFGVYYDSDGTFSYAFNVNMDGGKSRTFKIVADEFKGFEEITEIKPSQPINTFITPKDLLFTAKNSVNKGLGNVSLASDSSYIRFFGSGSASEAEGYFSPYFCSPDYSSGKYFVIKYRIPESNKGKTNFEFFTSTSSLSANAGESFFVNNPIADNMWHIAIVDMSAEPLSTFSAVNGEYNIKYIRFDIFNCIMAATDYIDIAYLGTTDDINKLCEYENSVSYAQFYKGGNEISSIPLN